VRFAVANRCGRYSAAPTMAPIRAVKPIARAPQNMTRIAGLKVAAPPVLAPIMPNNAKKTNDPTDTIGSSKSDGES
jgi:hypothetical protein